MGSRTNELQTHKFAQEFSQDMTAVTDVISNIPLNAICNFP